MDTPNQKRCSSLLGAEFFFDDSFDTAFTDTLSSVGGEDGDLLSAEEQPCEPDAQFQPIGNSKRPTQDDAVMSCGIELESSTRSNNVAITQGNMLPPDCTYILQIVFHLLNNSSFADHP